MALRAAALVAALVLAACTAEEAAAPPPVAACPAEVGGTLSGQIYGAVERRIDWNGADIRCDGGPRPGDAGIRMVFAPAAGEPLTLVIGIDAMPGELAGAEHAANVTLVHRGRFFSSGGRERCWTTVERADATSGGTRYRVTGELYCAGALPALGDSGSIRLRNFRYTGIVDMAADTGADA